MGSDNTRIAPYVPFKTLLNAIERLGSNPPHRIDKSLYFSFSGAVQGQILNAFRFLGLIDESGKVLEPLTTFLTDVSNRKGILGMILRGAYREIFEIGLDKASPKQLDEKIEELGVSGATHRKAVTFFVQACQYAEIPLSPFITGRKKKPGRKAGKSFAVAVDYNEEPDFEESSNADRKSKTITLRSGDGEVTLSMSFDPFTISPKDRDFIFGLIDTLGNYENAPKLKPAPPPMMPVPRRAPERTIDDDFPQGITDDDVPF